MPIFTDAISSSEGQDVDELLKQLLSGFRRGLWSVVNGLIVSSSACYFLGTRFLLHMSFVKKHVFAEYSTT